MSSRDRKRAERRKRKQRSADRGDDLTGADSPGPLASADGTGGAAPAVGGAGPPSIEDLAAEAEARGVSRSELKNQLAREQLEPLEEDERPRVVTIGAILSALIALVTVGAWIIGAKVHVANTDLNERPNVIQVFAPAILFGVMAWGMWRSRYWAVLGFEAVMAIIMVGSFITLIAATGAFQAISAALILIAGAALFWFTVKALARIQMPEQTEREPRR